MSSRIRKIYGTTLYGDLMINLLGVAIGIVFIVLTILYRQSIIQEMVNSPDSQNLGYYILGMFIFGYAVSFFLLRKVFCDKWEVTINEQTLKMGFKSKRYVIPIGEIKKVKITGNSAFRQITIYSNTETFRLRFGFYIESYKKGYKDEMMKEINGFINDMDEVLVERNYLKECRMRAINSRDVKALEYFRR